MKQLFFALFIVSLSACSVEKDKQVSSENEQDTEKYKYEVISDKKGRGLKITNIRIDTLFHHDTKALMATFNVVVSASAFDSIRRQGYESFFIDVTCTPDEGKQYLHRNEVFKSADKKKFIHKQKDHFISNPADRSLEVSIPFRTLEMSEGKHTLQLEFEAYPAKFNGDSSSLQVQQLHSIAASSYAGISVRLTANAPKLYKTSITVHGFKLNTQKVKPDKFDIGVSGYPDLFWEVYCGNDYVYYSPLVKNKILYNKSYTSPAFYCTKDDIVNLAVVDYDNGPFNTQDDVIEKYSQKITDLPQNKRDTLKFGNLEYLIIETKIE